MTRPHSGQPNAYAFYAHYAPWLHPAAPTDERPDRAKRRRLAAGLGEPR